MRPRTLLAALVLPVLLGAGSLGSSAIAEACGPYGPTRSDLHGEIVSERPASAGLSVRAVCEGEVYEGEVDVDGGFSLRGLPGSSCVIEATAHECYTRDRRVALHVDLPSEDLLLVIPETQR